MKGKKLSHTDRSGNPKMVDVSGKNPTRREARARAIVVLGEKIMKLLRNEELMTKKGPVFQTTILAGIAGAKKTSDLIPLCHPLGLDDCQILIKPRKDRVVIESRAVVTGKTGVEMEALTGVSVAALTVYDMCKALSHDIVIKDIMLLEKTGGKKDFKRK